jgi:UDP-N-acetyl-D-glucosamine 2-epimerase, UDP-hydrolysing
MAYLHFVAHKDYARRLMQMGEAPGRVCSVGSLGLEGIRRLKLLNKNELENVLGFRIQDRTALVTYHPVTHEKNAASLHIHNLLCAIKACKLNVIFTLPNADPENISIVSAISKYVQNNPRSARYFTSLGQLKYLSLMKYVDLMIGNSSSGLIETIPFKLPVVNIGNRQKGRIRPANVIDCGYCRNLIITAVKKALSSDFKRKLDVMENPFGSKSVAKRIKNKLKNVKIDNIVKGFCDLPQ